MHLNMHLVKSEYSTQPLLGTKVTEVNKAWKSEVLSFAEFAERAAGVSDGILGGLRVAHHTLGDPSWFCRCLNRTLTFPDHDPFHHPAGNPLHIPRKQAVFPDSGSVVSVTHHGQPHPLCTEVYQLRPHPPALTCVGSHWHQIPYTLIKSHWHSCKGG